MRVRVRRVQPLRCQWREPEAAQGFSTGVSLHSHTTHSRESLDFIPRVLRKVAPAWAVLRNLEEEHRRRTGKSVPYDRVFWRPPLPPRAAHDLEAGQIRTALGLAPLVSITDHDNIEACAELRAIGIEVPFSLEWTVPYEETVFHVGVHNLPPADARSLAALLAEFTAHPDPAKLAPILRELDALPEVLVVLNHPLASEERTAFRTHLRLLNRFLREHRGNIHALELNGLQPARHNRRVAAMARELDLPVVSGGDRHCLEANASLNLTNATSFAEFVGEVRREHVSRVLFMPQYRESIPCRYIEFIWHAVRTYPEFPGRERWVDRVFQQTAQGDAPLAAVWPHGGPWPIRSFISAVGFLASPGMRFTLRLALGRQGEAGA
jgi:hypothetical protein